MASVGYAIPANEDHTFSQADLDELTGHLIHENMKDATLAADAIPGVWNNWQEKSNAAQVPTETAAIVAATRTKKQQMVRLSNRGGTNSLPTTGDQWDNLPMLMLS